MDVREKLVELCKDLETLPCCDTYEGQAEYLISNGVTAQECKLGDKKTNADRIRSMSDEELCEFIRSMVDESNSHNVACYGCINYGTHHSDPANKGTPIYECDGCENEGIGLDVLMWLKQPAEEDDNETAEERKDGDD